MESKETGYEAATSFVRSGGCGPRHSGGGQHADHHLIHGLLRAERRAEAGSPQTSQSKKSFKEDVMPIFVGRCVSCHQSGAEGTAKSGLDLTSYAGVMKGTKFGPMVIPGDPESSNLMLLLDWRASPELRMPHGKKQLSSCATTSYL